MNPILYLAAWTALLAFLYQVHGVLALSVATCGLCLVYVLQPLTTMKYRGIQGPLALPLVGHLPQIMKLGSMAFFLRLKEQYGPVFKVWYGRRPFVVVTDPTIARFVGSKLLNHPNFLNASIMRGQDKQVESSGLLAARGDYWRQLRSTWQPAFSPSALSGYIPLMAESTDRLVERLHRLASAKAEDWSPKDGKGIDMWRELGAMTLQVVGSTAYGVDFHALEPRPREPRSCRPALVSAPGAALVEACKVFFRTASLYSGSKWSLVAMFMPELAPVWSRLSYLFPDQPLRDQRKARLTILNTSRALIQGWRQQHSADVHADEGNNIKAIPGGGSFLAQLLKSRAGAAIQLSDLQLAAQANTFTLAGYETTANGLAFTMYLLGCNPAAEEKLVAEADALANKLTAEGKPGLQAVTMEDLVHLPYAEACFQEALRLFPPAHLTTRETGPEPFTIPMKSRQGHGMTSVTVPANSTILLSINSIHHDPELWPEVEAFRPERFLEKQEGQSLIHVPFGYGSRMCIGYRFALAEAKLALARLYHEFTFVLVPGQDPMKVSIGITQAPKHGVCMDVRPRHAAAA